MRTPHIRTPRARRRALAAAILAACAATLAHAGADDALPASTAPTRPTANTIVVANCNDSGPGSLRAALAAAVDGDTIDLTQLTCGTITLTSGQLVNGHAISIVGPGADQLTIDGNATSRVLYSTGSLAINDLALANGNAAGSGGCLLVTGAVSATLTRVNVSGCVANEITVPSTFGLGYGGGIGFWGGTLTLVSSRVTGNTAQGTSHPANGGGIDVGSGNSQLHLIDSRVDGNLAHGPNAIGGGVLVTGVAAATFQSSVIEDNRAISTDVNIGFARGGGVAIIGMSSPTLGQFAMHGGRISGNLAERSGSSGGSALGGGIFISTVDALVDDGAIVSANTARLTYPNAPATPAAVGGGVYTSQSSSLTLTDALVTGNQAIAIGGHALGGGLRVGGPLTATRSAIGDNTAQSVGGYSYGGGISTIVPNPGSSAPVELHACTISGNTARSDGVGTTSRGGGVDAFDTILAAYSTIRGNAAIVTGSGSQARGGGLASTCHASSTNCGVTVRASTVSGNAASGGTGGGGIATSNSAFVAYNSTIAFNSAPSRGGGVIAAAGSASKAVSSIIADNTAPDGADISLPLATGGVLGVTGDHNLIVDASSSVTLPTDTLHGDPKLLSLANNGGATATHALAACSPAIDAGSNPSSFDHDQRLAPYARVFGGAADIGAFEAQPDADRIFVDGFEASPCP